MKEKQLKEVYTIISTYAVHGLFFIDLKRRLLPTLQLDRDNQDTLHKQLREHLTKKVKNIIYTKATEYKKVSRKTIDEQVNSIINNIMTQKQEAIVASLLHPPRDDIVDTIFDNSHIDVICAHTNIKKHIVKKYSGSYKLFQDVEKNRNNTMPTSNIKNLAENFIHSFSNSNTLPTTEIRHYPSKFYIFATEKNIVGVKYLDPKKKNEEKKLIHATTEQLLGNHSDGEKVSLKELFCLFCLDLWIQLLSPDWSGDLSKSLADIGGDLKSRASTVTKYISESSFPLNFKEFSTVLSKCIPTIYLVTIYEYWLKTVSNAYALQIESLQLLNYSDNKTVQEVIFAYKKEKLEVDYLCRTQKKFRDDLKNLKDLSQKDNIPYNIDELVKNTNIHCPIRTTKQTIQYIYRAILSFHRNQFKIIRAIKKLNAETETEIDRRRNESHVKAYKCNRDKYERVDIEVNVHQKIGMSFRTVNDLIIVTKIFANNQLSAVREGSIIETINREKITDANKLNTIIKDAKKKKKKKIAKTFNVPPPPNKKKE